MIDWTSAKNVVEATFFNDEIQLYENAIVEDELGEEHEVETLVGAYKCNVENSQNTVSNNISGQSSPQSLRISTVKSIPLVYSKTYKVKVIRARVVQSPDEYWRVDGWVEGQLSTVITASREVSI